MQFPRNCWLQSCSLWLNPPIIFIEVRLNSPNAVNIIFNYMHWSPHSGRVPVGSTKSFIIDVMCPLKERSLKIRQINLCFPIKGLNGRICSPFRINLGVSVGTEALCQPLLDLLSGRINNYFMRFDYFDCGLICLGLFEMLNSNQTKIASALTE